MRFHEFARIASLHHSKANKQSAEQQDFRRQEQPHADLGSVELLLHRGEVMLMVRIVVTAVTVNVYAGRTHSFVLISYFAATTGR